MVPKQEGEDQKGQRPEKPPGTAADGARLIQPFHDTAEQRGGGNARDAE